MRSLIILEVEHGEDTDALTSLAMLCSEVPDHSEGFDGIECIDWSVRVDLPACFVLDSDSTNNKE